MNLTQQRAAELRDLKRALQLEMADWHRRTQEIDKLKKHLSQMVAIKAKLDGFLSQVAEPDETTAEPFKEFERINRSLIGAHRVWAYFRSRLALREVEWLASDLRCADELAWECYRPARDKAEAAGSIPAGGLKEPPLVFFSNDASPFAQARHSVFEPEKINEQGDVGKLGAALLLLPFPVIGIPWFQARHLPMAVVVAHEVGHAVEHDFRLDQPLADAFTALGVDDERKAAWSSWRHELFADAYGVLCAGPAFVLALLHFLAGDPASIQGERIAGPSWGRYPNRFLRMLVNFQLLDHLGIADAALPAAWQAIYQSHPMKDFDADVPAVVAALLDTPLPSFGNVAVKEVVSFNAADVARTQVLADVVLCGSTLPPGERFRKLYAAAATAYYSNPTKYAEKNGHSALVKRMLASIPPGVRSAGATFTPARASEIQTIYSQTGQELLDLFAD